VAAARSVDSDQPGDAGRALSSNHHHTTTTMSLHTVAAAHIEKRAA
jgi:hypothetical protein